MNESVESVHRRAYKLRKKIQESDAPDKDTFLHYIPLRTTNGKVRQNNPENEAK